jgi:NADH-quinone oxidoreductase subunit G
VPEGANTAGASLAGALPHRDVGGMAAAPAGLDARAMIHAALKGYVLVGGIEPERDLAAEGASDVMQGADCVVALTPFVSESLKKVAHVLLPSSTFGETAGTFVNIEGRWQSFPGAAQPVGQSRPAWKILRVLGTLLDLPDFEYSSVDEVRNELIGKLGAVEPDNTLDARRTLNGERPQGVLRDVPMYQGDALVRRAPALQRTQDGQQPAVTY